MVTLAEQHHIIVSRGETWRFNTPPRRSAYSVFQNQLLAIEQRSLLYCSTAQHSLGLGGAAADPARYVYATDGMLLLREMGTFGATTPSTDMYALTDPTGTVIAITNAAGTVEER